MISGVRWQICSVYLNEVIVFNPSMETHVEQMEKVLSLLKEENVTLKMKKWSFFQSKVDYLGHTIMLGNLDSAIDNSSAIQKAPFSDEKTNLCSFLCARNLYNWLVEVFAKWARPLNEVLKK